MVWTKRGVKKDQPPGRKVALVEQPVLVTSEELPVPEAAREQEDVRRRASRRLKLLSGLLSRGKGEAID